MLYSALVKLSPYLNKIIFNKTFTGILVRIRANKNVFIGKNCVFESGVCLNAYKGKLIIKNNVAVNFNTVISAGFGTIKIDDNVLIGPNCTLRSSNHLKSIKKEVRRKHSQGRIIIEKNVWIGANVSILSGVTIGENSIIGAGSVVTKSIPKNSIAFGNPCKISKEI